MNTNTFRARNLRKNATIQEKRLWNILKNRQFHNLRFKRQVPIGHYIVDFVCPEIKLIIELDGAQHNEENGIEYDANRTEYLKSKGYNVIRFWNNEVYQNIEGVIKEIEKYVR